MRVIACNRVCKGTYTGPQGPEYTGLHSFTRVYTALLPCYIPPDISSAKMRKCSSGQVGRQVMMHDPQPIADYLMYTLI